MSKKRKVRCEVYSRIVGYLRPLRNWNEAKLQEFKERVNYKKPDLGDLNARSKNYDHNSGYR